MCQHTYPADFMRPGCNKGLGFRVKYSRSCKDSDMSDAAASKAIKALVLAARCGLHTCGSLSASWVRPCAPFSHSEQVQARQFRAEPAVLTELQNFSHIYSHTP